MADTGFPTEGATSLGEVTTYDFAKFSRKLHEIERIWMPKGGGRVLCAPPPDQPLHTPLPIANKAAQTGFETQRRCHQNSTTRVSVPCPQKDIFPPNFKENNKCYHVLTCISYAHWGIWIINCRTPPRNYTS